MDYNKRWRNTNYMNNLHVRIWENLHFIDYRTLWITHFSKRAKRLPICTELEFGAKRKCANLVDMNIAQKCAFTCKNRFRCNQERALQNHIAHTLMFLIPKISMYTSTLLHPGDAFEMQSRKPLLWIPLIWIIIHSMYWLPYLQAWMPFATSCDGRLQKQRPPQLHC